MHESFWLANKHITFTYSRVVLPPISENSTYNDRYLHNPHASLKKAFYCLCFYWPVRLHTMGQFFSYYIVVYRLRHQPMLLVHTFVKNIFHSFYRLCTVPCFTCRCQLPTHKRRNGKQIFIFEIELSKMMNLREYRCVFCSSLSITTYNIIRSF